MQRALTLYSTTIGKKVAMALSGVILLGFTVAHLAGNMNVYLGQEALDGYAAKLREYPGLLWTARLALLFAVSVHIISAAMLFAKKRQARPVPYAKKRDIASDYAAQTMYWSGPILLFYILFHLAHMTFGVTVHLYEWTDSVYLNMIHGFQHWQIILPYVLGVLALGTHLFHGIFSMFQSVGASHPKYDHLRRDLAVGLATLLTLGNLSFPVAVQLGWFNEVPGVVDESAVDVAEGDADTNPPADLH